MTGNNIICSLGGVRHCPEVCLRLPSPAVSLEQWVGSGGSPVGGSEGSGVLVIEGAYHFAVVPLGAGGRAVGGGAGEGPLALAVVPGALVDGAVGVVVLALPVHLVAGEAALVALAVG